MDFFAPSSMIILSLHRAGYFCPMSMTDDIVIRLQSGDPAAFTSIFECYWKQMFQAAYSRVNDEQLAKDIVQNIFLQIWDRRATLSLSSGTLEFYLLRAVRNQVINHYTSSKVKEAVLQKVMERMEAMCTDSQDLKRYLELEKFVDDQIESFPETMRAVFLLRSDHFTIQQIAATLNLAEQTVKNNITEAGRRLRLALSKEFSDDQLILLFITASGLIIP